MSELSKYNLNLSPLQPISRAEVSIIEELLSIYIEGKNRWESDFVIRGNVKKWLTAENQDPQHVFKLVNSQNNNPRYLTLLAFLNYCGIGTESNHEQTFYCYKKAADYGDPLGQQEVASCYQRSIGTRNDRHQAFLWYQKAANAEYASAQCHLGKCYLIGAGIKSNGLQAVHWLQRSSKAGFREAHFLLGWCYESGKGVKANMRKAFFCYKISADAGYIPAIQNRSRCLKQGQGTLKDVHEAMRNYSRSNEKGNLLFDLGFFALFRYI
ncbi:hypothetical protein G9A89_003504 [Geosiphon pyriformis]|nr:hypothetical protein G9A89_003504 [Geosiphon pyriformis]